jgi:hypothetical protein
MLLVLVTGRRFPETHAICDACRASPLNVRFFYFLDPMTMPLRLPLGIGVMKRGK